jgi:hypothetical protein
MGVLAGTKIFGHSPTQEARDAAIEGINTGDLQGLIMTDRVGGCGHNLTGANVMIFLGSLYSAPYEEQAIGTPCQCLPKLLIVARISRPGQTKICKVYIIADPGYEGDRMAFEIKNARKAEGDLMNSKFDKKKGDFRALTMVHNLFADDDDWEDWKEDQKLYEQAQMAKQKTKTTSSRPAAPPKVSPLATRRPG